MLTEKQLLLEELGKIAFSSWDISLYLDTHPFNSEALEWHHHYEKAAEELRKEYQKKYGPLTSSAARSGHCWEWIEGSWPWEGDN